MIVKVLLEIERAVFWACIAYVIADRFGWMRIDRGAKDLSGNRVKFGPSWAGIALLGVVVTMIPATARMFRHLQWSLLNLVAPVGMAIGLAVFLLELPGTIIVSDDGLEQRYWLGKNKRICWSDIVEINSGPKDRMVTIKSTDGATVIHSSFHSGRARLLKELKDHCGSELPEDFPREPLGNT